MANDSLIKKLKILKIIKETENARTFILEPMDGWQPEYKAGQFITLVFYTRYGEKRRSFSMTSSPQLNEPLSITIKKVDNGEFSRPLVYDAKPGDIFSSSGISGLFTLPENAQHKMHCFLAAGSGITPCLSLIKTLLATTQAQIILFYSNKNKEDALFYEQLYSLQQENPDRFKARFLFSDHHDIYYKRMSKWLLGQLLDEYVKDADNTLFYLCGPFDYMQMAEIPLLNRTSRANIIKESFSSLPRMVLPEPPDKAAHNVTIRINQKTYLLDVQYPKSVLKTAIEHKIQLPYSCMAGRCGSCIATCSKGKAWMAYNEILVDSEVEKGRILTCQAFPVEGDIEIVFDEQP